MGFSPVRYQIHPLWLEVESDQPELVDHLDRILKPFRSDRSPCDSAWCFTLRLRQGAVGHHPFAEANLHEMWRGQAPNGLTFSYYSGPQLRQIVSPGVLAAKVDFARKEAAMLVAPDRPWAAAYGALTPMLSEILWQLDHYVLHAACVSVGNASDAPAVVICAPSGYGKSTTSLALRDRRLKLVCDDTCFLHRGGGVRLWGLPRPAKVSAGTLKLLPELDALPRRVSHTDDEWQVDMASLQPDWQPRSVRPVAIVVLARPGEGDHVLEPIDRLEALGQLAASNVHTVQHAAGNPAKETFRILTDLVGQCRTYRLSAGPDLAGLKRLLASQLQV